MDWISGTDLCVANISKTKGGRILRTRKATKISSLNKHHKKCKLIKEVHWFLSNDMINDDSEAKTERHMIYWFY